MNYREKVMAYAEVINGMSPGAHQLIEKLRNKIAASIYDKDSLDFWHEVLGRMIRKGLMSEIESLEELERSQVNNTTEYPKIERLVRSQQVLDWIKMLDPIDDELMRVLDYQKDNFITENPKLRQKRMVTLDNLKFFNMALGKGITLKESFDYIPLLNWSILNLIESNNFDTEFLPFLNNSLVPILRTHTKLVKELMGLIDEEESYIKREASESENKLRRVEVFQRDYKAEELDITKAEPLANNVPPKQDPYYCPLSYLIVSFETDRDFREHAADHTKRAWHLTPLMCLYRLRLHSKKLGVHSEYMPAVRPKILHKIDNIMYTHQKIYSEDNLVEGLTLAVYQVMSKASNSEYKELYSYQFKEMYVGINDHLVSLLDVGLITTDKARNTLNELLNAAEECGLDVKDFGR